MNSKLHLSYCGYMIREKDENLIYRPAGSGNYLFLYFPSGIFITLNQREYLLKKHSCIFFAPKDYQRFRGIPAFLNTYVHFTADADYMDSLNIPFSQPFYPDCYEMLNQLVLEIQSENLATDRQSDTLANLALQKLLLLSSRHFSSRYQQTAENNTVRRRLEQLRLKMLTDCAYPWAVQELAERAAMSRSVFYDYYKKFFRTSPKAELLETRMAKAKLLLTNKAITVYEAAQKCGFENLSHFTRYYKKYYGQPPRGK